MSKKTQAAWVIVQHTAVNAVASGVPTPGLEIHKHVALSSSEIAMCVRIASIYSGIEMSKDRIEDLLKEAGIAVAAGAGLAVAATTIGHGVVDELLNWIPVVGWAIKGTLAGSLTVGVGVAFVKFCEERYGSYSY